MSIISPYVYVGLSDVTFSIRQPRYLFNRLLTIVCIHMNVSSGDLLSSRRHRPLVMARQMMGYLLRKEYDLNLTTIGRLFGKHHSTIIHQLKSHGHDFETSRQYREMYINIKEQLL